MGSQMTYAQARALVELRIWRGIQARNLAHERDITPAKLFALLCERDHARLCRVDDILHTWTSNTPLSPTTAAPAAL